MKNETKWILLVGAGIVLFALTGTPVTIFGLANSDNPHGTGAPINGNGSKT